VLDGKGQLESDGEHTLVRRCGSFREKAKRMEMLGRDGEPHAAHAFRVTHAARGLDQMFFEGRPDAVGVAMKRDEALRNRRVRQTVLAHQRVDDLGRAARAPQDVQVVPAEGQLRAQIVDEGEAFDPFEQDVNTRPRDHLLEHARRRTGRRNELRAAALSRRLVVKQDQRLLAVFRDRLDPVFEPARTREIEVTDVGFKQGELALRFVLGDAALAQLRFLSLGEQRHALILAHGHGRDASRRRVGGKGTHKSAPLRMTLATVK